MRTIQKWLARLFYTSAWVGAYILMLYAIYTRTYEPLGWGYIWLVGLSISGRMVEPWFPKGSGWPEPEVTVPAAPPEPEAAKGEADELLPLE